MKQFLRNFKKQRTVGLLNICSLSLGVMAAIIVGLHAINELSFDNFHKDKEDIHRAVLNLTLNDSPVKVGSTYSNIGTAAKDKLPQIQEMIRVSSMGRELRIKSVFQSEVDIYMVDPNFFSFFSFPLKEGDPETVLSSHDKAVISESAAIRYFPGSNPMGQVITISNHDFTISGIMKNMPRNSSLQTDFILPFHGYFLEYPENTGDSYITFFKIQKGVDLKVIENDLTDILVELLPMVKTANPYYTLEHLSDMHFSEGFLMDRIAAKGNKPMIMVLTLVALVILIISCINFTNLFISTSFIRAKSVGIMKSLGANRASLIQSFYGETAYYVAIAIAAGIGMSFLVLPVFNNFTGSNMIIDLTSVYLYLFLFVLFVFTVVLAGTFPALYITRFNPVETLIGRFKGKGVSLFQKSLIIVQFSASIAMLIVVSFMQKQVDFMITKDLGFDKENIIYVHGRDNFGLKNHDMLRDEFIKHPFITDVTVKNSLPTNWQNGNGLSKPGSDELIIMEMNNVKPNYFEMMDMKIIEGENPFHLESQDSIIPVILNERAVRLLNLESPINTILSVNFGYETLIVKGVMKNANIRSLRDEIDPQVYMKINNNHWSSVYFFKYTGDPQQTIGVLKQKWQELEPDTPFQYHFLDETYKGLYSSETNVGKVLAFAMLITFVISIAGLFAMTFYATQRRIKEISLRKVNGATLKELLMLLNRDFIIWVSISFVIAVPIAWFSLQSWLEGFTVKTPLSIWVFVLVGIVSFIVTLLTTSYQTWKVAQMDPAKTLKQQ